jgi:hypothetical protein
MVGADYGVWFFPTTFFDPFVNFPKKPPFREDFSYASPVNSGFLYEILEILHFFSLQLLKILVIVKSYCTGIFLFNA